MTMVLEFVSRSIEDTAWFGRILGKRLPESIPGLIIGLTGPLGSGKTALVRAMAKGAEVPDENVVSPTFGIVVPYQGRLGILHMDAYRIGAIEELDELGLDEQIDLGAVLICEWVERVEPGLPELDLLVAAHPIREDARRYELEARTDVAKKFLAQVKLDLEAADET